MVKSKKLEKSKNLSTPTLLKLDSGQQVTSNITPKSTDMKYNKQQNNLRVDTMFHRATPLFKKQCHWVKENTILGVSSRACHGI